MRVKIFVITNNPKFFFKINKELKNLRIKFKILNFKEKIPKSSFLSLILTTKEELGNLQLKERKNIKILSYEKGEDIDKFVFNLLKFYRCGINNHSELLFSVDPGKTIGLVVFLDGYFFYAKTFFNKFNLINNIRKCFQYIEEEKQNDLKLIFKFGRGEFKLTSELLEKIYNIFKDKKKLNVYLINESKSSKLNLHKISDRISKHEASALVLALRNGIKVGQKNYDKFFDLKKYNQNIKQELENEETEISYLIQNISTLKAIFLELINCKMSIHNAFDLIKKREIVA